MEEEVKEDTPVFPASVPRSYADHMEGMVAVAGKFAAVEKSRQLLHKTKVATKFDLIGSTLLQKKEFDLRRKEQTAWINDKKRSTHTNNNNNGVCRESIGVPQQDQTHEEEEGEESNDKRSPFLVSRDKSQRLPLLSPAQVKDATRKRRQEYENDPRKSRRVSLKLGQTTHQQDLHQPIASKKSPTPLGYRVLEFMANKSEFEHLCSFNNRCKSGTRATIKCYSCIKFDNLMLGHYCDECFREMHPPHRVPHKFVQIEVAPPPPKEAWHKHMNRLEYERNIQQFELALQAVKQVSAQSGNLLPNQEAFDKITKAEETCNHTYDAVRQFRKKLPKNFTPDQAAQKLQTLWRIRKNRIQFASLIKSIFVTLHDPETGKTVYFNRLNREVYETPPKIFLNAKKLMNPSDAARMVQGLWRRKKARRLIVKMLQLCVEKRIDKKTGKAYYHNVRTKHTTWHCPAFLTEDLVYTPRTRKKKSHVEQKKLEGRFKSAELLSKDEAARMIQGRYRAKTCRRKLEAVMLQLIRKVTDKQTGKTYYFNTRTGETSWNAPSILNSSGLAGEIEEYDPSAIVQQTNAKQQEKLRPRRVYKTREEAAFALQGMYRRKKARDRLRRLFLCNLEKYFDSQTGKHYFLNKKTKEVSWDLPSGLTEADVMTPRSRHKLALAQERKDRGVFKTADILSPDEAAKMIQIRFRAKRSRKQFQKLLLSLLRRVRDPATGKVYYYNTETGATMWELPSMVRDDSVRSLASMPSARKEKRVFHSPEEAALALQKMWHTRKARRRFQALLTLHVEKYFDETQQKWYFYNTKTKQVHWDGDSKLYSAQSILTPRSRAKRAHVEKKKELGVFKTAATLSEEDAARMVQKQFRAKKLREQLRQVFLERIAKARDEDGNLYYIDKETGKTTWTMPLLLRDLSLSKLQSFKELSKEELGNHRKRTPRVFSSPDEAASLLQGMYRQKKARDKVRALLLCYIEKAVDADGNEYYFNVISGTSSWVKPSALTGVAVLTPRSRKQKLLAEQRKEKGLFKSAQQLSEEDAAMMVQKHFRAMKIRRRLRQLLLDTIVKARDADGNIYWVNQETNHATYFKPTLLREVSNSKLLSWDKLPLQGGKRKGDIKLAKDLSEDEAALMVQRRFRAVRAREKLRGILLQSIVKARDADGNVFFVNQNTGEASWFKPTLLRDMTNSRLQSYKDIIEESPRYKMANELSESEAAIIIQGRFRAMRTRERIRSMLVQTILRAKDDEGNTYFVNTMTGESSWRKPNLLRNVSDSNLAAVKQAPTQEEAAILIQGHFRASLARERMRSVLLRTIAKARDEDGNEFFVNVTTGESSWSKPTLLRNMSTSQLLSYSTLSEE